MKKIYAYTKTLFVAMMAVMALTSCETDDHYLAEQLIDRDWQGYLGTYYQDRWGISGQEYRTVMRFVSRDSYATSGRGYELDYRTSSWREDYAYCTFKWFIVDGEITLIYDDDKWSPIYIVDYRLTGATFDGYIYDGSDRRIVFEFDNVPFDDWGYYTRGGYGGYNYGDFTHQNYYRAPAATRGNEPADSASVPYINNGKSILSGVFATSNAQTSLE